MFKSWLDRQLKVYFKPLVEVVATQEIPNANDNFTKPTESKEQNDKGYEKNE